MPNWHERLTRETNPAVRAEHHLRYALAAELLRTAPVWTDLGCGAGLAAADALGGSPFAGHVVLVDVDGDAVQEAARVVPAATTTAVQADLADDAALARVREAVAAAGAGGLVTCFEVVEHLATFVPLLDLLVELSDEAGGGHTVVLSVPNDAFWAIENPYHLAMWGEGSFDELRRVLPDDHVVARQVPLAGSAVVVGDEDAPPLRVPEVGVGADRVPSHLLAAFGPRAGELHAAAHVAALDLDGQRRWERQRESQLAHHEAELAELRAYVRGAVQEFGRLKDAGVDVRIPQV